MSQLKQIKTKAKQPIKDRFEIPIILIIIQKNIDRMWIYQFIFKLNWIFVTKCHRSFSPSGGSGDKCFLAPGAQQSVVLWLVVLHSLNKFLSESAKE